MRMPLTTAALRAPRSTMPTPGMDRISSGVSTMLASSICVPEMAVML